MEKEELITKIREHHQTLIEMATGKSMENFYETYEDIRADLLQLDYTILPAIPHWIYENKLGNEFWRFIKGVSSSYQPRRVFINRSFADLYDYIEKGANNPVSLSISEVNLAINNDYIELLWKKIYSRKSFDNEGAITACKTLIETTLKHLLDKADIDYLNKDDIKVLYKKVSKSYGIEPAHQKSGEFTQLCSGYISIVDSISAIRNKYGDAHGKSMKAVFAVNQMHVDLVVNMTGSIVAYLLTLPIPSQVIR